MRLTPLHSMLWPGLRSTAALAAIHPTRTARIHKTGLIMAFTSLALNLPHRLAASVAGTLAPVGVRAKRREHAQGATFRLRIHLGDAQLIALLATMLSIAFYIWYAQQDLTLAYGDSISHMMIARRVLVGRHPGLAELGTVWPPFTHILMLPLVWNDDLYRSGFAGAFPSMVAYVLSAVYTLRLGRLAFGSRTAGWVAALALVLNPNVLYMQSTPMTEMGLICAAVIAIYYAVAWAHDAHTSDLVKCAAATAAGTLIRYDGWALALVLAVIIGYIAWRRGRWVYAESHLLLYGMLAFAGCAAWFVYNRVIFGNWLEFYNGIYSTKAQQIHIQVGKHIPTIGNPVVSLSTYGFATLDSAGSLLMAASLLGLLGWLIGRRHYRTQSLPILAVLVPFLFNWMSLTTGTSILVTPEIALDGSHTYFNERYGMMMLPAVALFAAWLAARNRPLLVAIFSLILLFTVSDTFLMAPYALQDPLQGFALPGRTQAKDIGQWMGEHCQAKTILVSSSTLGVAMFYSKLPDTAFLTEGDGADFSSTLAHPEQSASCIAMSPTTANYDPVWDKLHDRQDWRRYFVLRKVIDSVELYQRVGNLTSSTPSASVAYAACCQMSTVSLSLAPQSNLTSPAYSTTLTPVWQQQASGSDERRCGAYRRAAR